MNRNSIFLVVIVLSGFSSEGGYSSRKWCHFWGSQESKYKSIYSLFKSGKQNAWTLTQKLLQIIILWLTEVDFNLLWGFSVSKIKAVAFNKFTGFSIYSVHYTYTEQQEEGHLINCCSKGVIGYDHMQYKTHTYWLVWQCFTEQMSLERRVEAIWYRRSPLFSPLMVRYRTWPECSMLTTVWQHPYCQLGSNSIVREEHLVRSTHSLDLPRYLSVEWCHGEVVLPACGHESLLGILSCPPKLVLFRVIKCSYKTEINLFYLQGLFIALARPKIHAVRIT